MTDVVAGLLVLIASLFLFLAALSLLRMPDLYSRLGAASKAVAFGGGLAFVAVAVAFGDAGIVARAVAGTAFLLLTAPVTAHVIARAALHLGIPFAPGTRWADEIRPPGATRDEETDGRDRSA